MNALEVITEGTKRFLREYIKDSAFYINRFLVGYDKNKLRQTLSMFGATKEESEECANGIKSYHPIDKTYIYDLYLFYEALVNQEPSKQNIVVYRGCDTLEDHAMDGISATSLNKKIANNFNYGTLLKINIPAGSQFIVCSEFVHDEEEQILLPPCDYEIVSECTENISGRSTRVVEINVKPRDILKEFSIAMQRPTKDYIDENGINQDYLDAFGFLTQIMVRRALNDYPETLLQNALDNRENESYPKNRKGIDPYSDILLIGFIMNMSDKKQEDVAAQIENDFYYTSPEEQRIISGLVASYKKQTGHIVKKKV